MEITYRTKGTATGMGIQVDYNTEDIEPLKAGI
jgi:hypothetical protein